MDIFGTLSLIGGLALFLYGMTTMGQGLEKLSGGRLEKILSKLTSNPIKSVLLGAAVTAVIQSSSATTVMVVGFVNSGIMNLSQAVGVIMGANIGTTATSWLLSLTGIQSDNIFLKLITPESFTPILAVIAVVFIMFTKSEKKKNIGLILIGFSLLMFGMTAMSSAVKPLAENEGFTSILTLFSNPFFGVLAGAVLTAILQSSSASIGILQALSSTVSMSFGSVLPIIMGQNIGTCVTAMLSSIGASKNAKRAAFVHLYFNLIGTILFLTIFYLLNAFINFSFVQDVASPAGIAVIHSIFNIFATVVLLPFTKQLEKLATITVKDEKTLTENGNNPFDLLDPRFLSSPSLAIQQCNAVTVEMSRCVKKSLRLSIELLTKYSEKDAETVKEKEEEADMYEDRLGSYLLQLSSRDLSENDSRVVTMLLHTIGDFERISDHAVNIMECAKEMNDKGLSFSKKATVEIKVFTEAVLEILELAINSFETQDIELAKSVEPLEEVIDHIRTEVKNRHIKRLRKGKCTIEMGFVLSDLITNYERVADHCSNIAVCLIEVNDNSFETHEYINNLKDKEDPNFTVKYLKFTEKYMLP